MRREREYSESETPSVEQQEIYYALYKKAVQSDTQPIILRACAPKPVAQGIRAWFTVIEGHALFRNKALKLKAMPDDSKGVAERKG